MAEALTAGGDFTAPPMLAEINVTPFVDVMLVLLIIFMITAHVMEFGIEVDVPKVRAVKDSAQELPVLNITKDGNIYLNDKGVNIQRACIRSRQALRHCKGCLPASRPGNSLGQ